MAKSLRKLSDSGLTAAPTPRSIPAPPMKARACHHPSRQRQPSLTCDPVSNHALQLPSLREPAEDLQRLLCGVGAEQGLRVEAPTGVAQQHPADRHHRQAAMAPDGGI